MIHLFWPETVPLRTVNRQCSSGLQAVADVATAIKAGLYDIGKCNSDSLLYSFSLYSITFLLSYSFFLTMQVLLLDWKAWLWILLALLAKLTPKYIQTLLARRPFFYRALVPSIKFIMLTGRDLYSSSGLSSSYGYHFWKCCTKIWCDTTRARPGCRKSIDLLMQYCLSMPTYYVFAKYLRFVRIDWIS